MPHLTATGALTQMGMGVPGYAHPLLAPVEWAELTRPGTPVHWAVLNVAEGPGDRPDPHCLEAAGRLRNAGVRVLGHIDLRHGSRPFAEVVADARRFLDWYKADGYYLDRAPVDRADLPAVRRISATLEALLDGEAGPSGAAAGVAGAPGAAGDGRAHLVLGHGAHPYAGYAEVADQLVTFSGTWADYRWSQVAEWTADHPAGKFVHLVHGVPRMHLEEALRIARWQGAATVFFTDRRGRPGQTDQFQTLPGYWDEIVSRIGRGVSE
ncbi:spherulation-specific family 4 protein [Streptomyces sp. NPDC085481]|uniref:spherulation-specific family 4 protein n=1 Tax=Streptomyces sp. NPDC085481 TaxID=3365727 RepID=UPI0037CF454C